MHNILMKVQYFPTQSQSMLQSRFGACSMDIFLFIVHCAPNRPYPANPQHLAQRPVTMRSLHRKQRRFYLASFYWYWIRHPKIVL